MASSWLSEWSQSGAWVWVRLEGLACEMKGWQEQGQENQKIKQELKEEANDYDKGDRVSEDANNHNGCSSMLVHCAWLITW